MINSSIFRTQTVPHFTMIKTCRHNCADKRPAELRAMVWILFIDFDYRRPTSLVEGNYIQPPFPQDGKTPERQCSISLRSTRIPLCPDINKPTVYAMIYMLGLNKNRATVLDFLHSKASHPPWYEAQAFSPPQAFSPLALSTRPR